jgi:putative tryptophan/tyrosine transport system substrate-binding protein
VDRRAFLGTLTGGFLARPLAVCGQQTPSDTRQVHVGILGYGTGVLPHLRAAFRARLADFGYVPGQNIAFDERYVGGRRDRVHGFAVELIALHVRAIVVVGPYVVKIANGVARDTPLVAIDLESDPVAEGFAKSLARPGGNVTGTFLDQADLTGKWLQLLRELNPRLSRVAVVQDSSTPSYQFEALKRSAISMAVELQPAVIATHDDFKQAFDAASKSRSGAVVLLSSPLVSNYSDLLASLSIATHLPTVSMFRENVTAGCMVSYGPSLADGWAHVAAFVGRILNGAKPADLPIERPTTFELALNVKTAMALGLTIPPSLLQRADQVIE